MSALPEEGLDLLFREARTPAYWSEEAPPEALIQELYDLAKMGPTSTNSLPGRFVWIVSKDGKERLKPHMSPTNRGKTMAAPWTVIVAYDPAFYRQMSKTFPIRADAAAFYADNAALAEETAIRNAALQGAYLMIAARALGLDCGPMSGFDAAGVEREFLAEQGWKAHWICNIGFTGGESPFPRLPRLDFDEANRIV